MGMRKARQVLPGRRIPMKQINNKFNKYVMIFIITIFIFSLTGTTISANQKSGGELLGDKLVMEQLKDKTNQYKVEAEGAVLKYHQLIIKGDFARFNTSNRQILFEGDVEVDNNNFLLMGNKLEGNLQKEEFTITGGVKLKGTDLKIEAGSLVYDHKTKRTILTEKTSLNYHKIKANSDKITFNLEDRMVYLSGNVEGQQNGQRFSAEEITIDLKKEKIKMNGKAKFIFPDRGEN